MNVNKIGNYYCIPHKGNVPSEAAKAGKEKLAEVAKKELEMIESQGHIAGTDAAWWRYEFGEAKAALERIAASRESESYSSKLMSFHDTDDDGFI